MDRSLPRGRPAGAGVRWTGRHHPRRRPGDRGRARRRQRPPHGREAVRARRSTWRSSVPWLPAWSRTTTSSAFSLQHKDFRVSTAPRRPVPAGRSRPPRRVAAAGGPVVRPGLSTTAEQRRAALREQLASGRLLRFPGAISPLTAVLIEELGFDGCYVSGAALSADLALPDIGLTTLDEVAGRSGQIAAATALPTLVDADTGFGEPMNVARTIQTLEARGLAGCHLEDQVNPKRCGHLDGKTVVPTEEMVRRVTGCRHRQAGRQLRGLRPYRRAGHRRTRRRDRPGEGLRRCRRRHGVPRGPRRRGRVRRFPRRGRRAAAGQHDRVRQVAAAVRSNPGVARLQPGHLPGHPAAPGDGRHRGRPAHPARRGQPGVARPARCRPASGSTSCCTTTTTRPSTPTSSTSASTES